MDIDLETSISQKIKTKDFEKLKTTQAIKEDSKVADVEWNSLTDEQKANMLNNLQDK